MQLGTQEKLGGVVETTLETDSQYLLEVRGLTKIFGSLKACDHVDLKIRQGEIHSLARRKRRRQVDAGQDAVRLA